MFNWLMQNIATILISIALMAVTALIIARLVRQKKTGQVLLRVQLRQLRDARQLPVTTN